MCNDLQIFWNPIFTTLTSPDLSYGLDNVLNALVVELPRILINFLVGVFQNLPAPPFTCTGTAAQQLACQLGRPPKFDNVTNLLCSAGFHLGNLTDTALTAVFDSFFDTSFVLPPIGPFINGILGIIFEYMYVVIDIVFHIDLVFEPNVNYLAYVNITNIFQPATNISQGFNAFFTATELPEGSQFGCAIGNATNAGIYAMNFTTYVLREIVTNFANVPTFITHTDLTPITIAWNNFLDCITQIIYAINVPIGDSFSYTFKAVESLANTMLNLLVNLPTFQSYLKHNFQPQIQVSIQYLKSAAVGYGNFWRQFDTTGLCPFPAINPPGKVPDPFPDQNFFCCFGGFVTSFVQFFLDVTASFLNMLVEIISDSQNVQAIAGLFFFCTKKKQV